MSENERPGGPDEDDEAFTFLGDDEPAFTDHPQRSAMGPRVKDTANAPATGSQGSAAPGRVGSSDRDGRPASGHRDAADEGEIPQTPSVVLLFYGVLLGAYGLYTFGWGWLAVTWWQTGSDMPLLDVLGNVFLVLSACAPGLWLGVTFWLTHGKRLVWTALWLLLGIVLLMPWPVFVASEFGYAL